MLKDYGLSKRLAELHDLKPRQCFTNAALLSLVYNWDYVEGYLKVHGVPIEHAWVVVDNQIVDPTLPKDPEEWYYAAFSLNSKQVSFFNKYKVYGPYYPHKTEYRESMLNVLRTSFGL